MNNAKVTNLVLLPLLGISGFALGWVLKPAPEAEPARGSGVDG